MHVPRSIADVNETHVIKFLFGKVEGWSWFHPLKFVVEGIETFASNKQKQKNTQTKNENENPANCRISIK